MSSHHFVREGQEPALLIAGIRSFEDVASLLEWAPFVVVTEPVLDKVLTLGIKIDAVVINGANLPAVEMKMHHHFPLQLITHEHSQNSMSAAIEYLIQSQNAVHVVTENVMQPLFTQLEAWCRLINISLTDGAIRWIPVLTRFEKWMPAASRLLVYKRDGKRLNYAGLKEVNENEFEAVADGQIVFQTDEIFWIGETIR